MDVSVITSNFKFLILQGLIGIGPFIGGTLRLAIPAILFGSALGMTGTKTMTYVVLPQALKNMVPSLVTQMIVLFKDTSLASIIGYVDLTKAAQIVNNREIKPFQIYIFIAIVYWLCTYSMSA